jgi:hypothetical protein
LGNDLGTIDCYEPEYFVVSEAGAHALSGTDLLVANCAPGPDCRSGGGLGVDRGSADPEVRGELCRVGLAFGQLVLDIGCAAGA